MKKEADAGERRGSILDLFFIFLFLLCIVGALLRWQELHRENTDIVLERFLLTAESEAVDARISECLTEGEILYTASGELFGKVRAVEAKPVQVTLLADGTYYSGSWDAEKRCRIEVEIEVEGVKNGEVLLRNGRIPLTVGQSVSLYSERTALTLKLFKLTPIEP